MNFKSALLLALLGLATASVQAQNLSLASNAPPAPPTPAANLAPGSADELRAALAQVQAAIHAQAQRLDEQHQLIERQQSEIEALRFQIAAREPSSSSDQQLAVTVGAACLNAEVSALRTASASNPAPSPVVAAPLAPQAAAESANTPLSIHFGSASLTPGGWVDFTAIYRSTDVGTGLGTNFASIPYANTVQGGLSETRITAQASRISLRADETFGKTKVFGYAEADFNGYLPSNAYVSTNSDSLRLRVYFADLSRGHWELLGGQSWSTLTPNRVGVSPFLSEIYNTLHLDSNYQVGLTYARQTQLRTVYHFSDNLALAVAIENPQQFTGPGVTFPALFSSSQADVNSSTGSGGGTATPTLHPDLIAKFAADALWAGRKWHFETAGLLTPIAILTPASVTNSTRTKDIHEGAGISAAANLEVVRNLHLILTGFWSDGGGRYIGGQGPAFVVTQSGSTAAPFTAQLVHSGSGIAAAEWRATRSTVLSATYSAAYFGRVFSTDPSNGALIGYGFTGSANSNNRALQEGTFATQTTLWQRQGYGSVQVITQSSYITRAPWYIAPNTPKDAHTYAGYANLRYVLP